MTGPPGPSPGLKRSPHEVTGPRPGSWTPAPGPLCVPRLGERPAKRWPPGWRLLTGAFVSGALGASLCGAEGHSLCYCQTTLSPFKLKAGQKRITGQPAGTPL